MAAKYKLIIEYINKEINCGNLKSEEKIPSIREISNKFSCSNATVIHAYSELENNNIIYSKPQSGYYVRKKFKHTCCCDDENDDLINFDSGSPSKKLLPYEDFQNCLNEAINLYGYDLFNYTHPNGFSHLISTLQEAFKKDGINADLKNIRICSGAQQALNILCNMKFPNNKTAILVEQPTYNLIVNLLQISNCEVFSIERNLEGIDFIQLEKIFRDKNIKFFYTMPRFHNPLGTSYTNEEKKRLIELAEKYDVYIVEDDYLSDLEIDINSKALYTYDNNSRVIYVKSFSKTYLPGIRIAAAIVPNKMLAEFQKFKVSYDLNSCLTSQGALNVSINNGMFNKHIEKIKKVYSKKMNTLKNTLEQLNTENIKYYIPPTGFFIFIKLPEQVKASELINNLRIKNIYVRNGDHSFLPQYKNDSYIRMCISKVNEEQIKNFLPEIINEINSLNSINYTNKIDFI